MLELWRRLAPYADDPAIVQRITADLLRAGPILQPCFPPALYRMEERLPRLRCPALLVYVSGDKFASPERCKLLCEAFKPAATELRLECGLWCTHEQPAAVAALIRAFV